MKGEEELMANYVRGAKHLTIYFNSTTGFDKYKFVRVYEIYWVMTNALGFLLVSFYSGHIALTCYFIKKAGWTRNPKDWKDPVDGAYKDDLFSDNSDDSY